MGILLVHLAIAGSTTSESKNDRQRLFNTSQDREALR